jgi:hypothetical protein
MHAHLLDGDPITDVLAISGTVERYRRFVVDGLPVATGIVAVADAWACTNPSLGRGVSLGLRHAVCLRDVVRTGATPARLAEAFDAATEAELTPWYRDTRAVDRARQAEIDAIVDGRPVPPPGDDAAAVGRAFATAMAYDPELFRTFVDVLGVIDLPDLRPELVERIMAIARHEQPPPAPGPTRRELLELVA